MKTHWLWDLLYGFLSGFSEFLPVSSAAHQALLERMAGVEGKTQPLRLAASLAALVAVWICCRPQLRLMRRELRIARIPPKRRKRQPDRAILLTRRFWLTAAVPLVLGSLVQGLLGSSGSRLWLLALMLTLCGILVYIPQFFRRGNKSALTASGLDGILVGLGGALGAVPGFSGLGSAVAVGSLRGLDRSFAVDMALLLCIPALLVQVVFDLYGLAILGFAALTAQLLGAILVAILAFVGAWTGVKLIRFLAVNSDFSFFAYYNWGMALFVFILYLMI